MVEPDQKQQDYILRKMMTTDEKGNAESLKNPPHLERKDNLFRFVWLLLILYRNKMYLNSLNYMYPSLVLFLSI